MKQILIFLLLSPTILLGQKLTSIKVLVPNKSDDVYIVGNQKNLGNWQPNKVKMNRVSDYERIIELDLTYPAEYKFTRGKWESEAIITKLYGQPNFILNDQPKERLEYNIQGWTDNIESYSTFNTFQIESHHSEILKEQRKIYVSLPENYNNDIKYPVIYITDAQNLSNFEIAQQSLRQQANFKNFPETVLIGIYQTDRNSDFGLNKTTHYNNQFQNYIFEELIPFVNQKYSTSGYKAVIGHSNGSEYNHYLMFSENNPFDGFVNISEEINALFLYMDQERFNLDQHKYKSFFKQYSGKPIDLFVASGKYDFWHRLKAGKVIDSLYQAYPNTKINFKHELYPAEHNSLVGKSMLDALKFLFQDYKDFDLFHSELIESKDYKKAKEKFLDNSKRFGDYQMTIEDEDIIQTIVFKTKDFQLFKQWNEIENSNNQLYSNLYLGSILTDIEPIKASKYFDKAIAEKDQEIIRFLPAIVYNEVQILNLPKDAISKLEKILVFKKSDKNDVSNELVIKYFIAKTSIENDIEKSKGKKALKFCNENYLSNRYFTIEELNKLNNK